MQMAQRAAERIFHRLNCNIDVVPVAVEGMSEVLHDNFDMIFVDIQLPDMDGIVLAKIIRQLEKQGKRVPLIVISSSLTQDLIEKGKKVGCDDFVQKPLTMSTAKKLIFKHLGKSV